MIVELTLDPATLAQIDALARRLGIQAVGDDRDAKRRAEVVRRLLMLWEAQVSARPLGRRLDADERPVSPTR